MQGKKQKKKKYLRGMIDLFKKTPILIGPRREKTGLWGFANNKGADQTAYQRSLISAFVISSLERAISKLSTGAISIF